MAETNKTLRDKELGCFWKRENDGETFLSGYVTIDGKKHSFIGRKNKWKQEGEKTPDWRLYMDESRIKEKPAEIDI